MNFDELLQLVEQNRLGVCADSRKVKDNDVFVAVKGTQVDGHKYIEQAIKAGAKYIVCQKNFQKPNPAAEIIQVNDTAPAVGILAQASMGWPARKLFNLAVTGTNGKTTVGFLVKQIIETSGYGCGLIGTVVNHIGSRSLTAEMTTPDPVDIAAMQRQMVDHGMRYMMIEASSHALQQQRLAGIEFKSAAFTNLTGDHLDYHVTMDNYLAAKSRLFTSLNVDSVAVLNGQSDFAEKIAKLSQAKIWYYSISQQADIWADEIEYGHERTCYKLRFSGDSIRISSPLLGRHNVSNHLAAAGLSLAAGLELQDIKRGLETATVPGRLEPVHAGQKFAVLIDYAHTDDALANVLETLKEICDGRLIVVFGCGGDRDKTKRPRMAKVAEQLADIVFVTNDNPRTEKPEKIIEDIITGFNDKRKVTVESDRSQAIGLAVQQAADGDIVLIAGKGHEDYQIIGTERIHFSDRETALEKLKLKMKR